MYSRLVWIGFVGILILTFNFSSGQGNFPTPTFPDVFEVEVQGIFREEMTEVDASMYYDRLNNRASIFYTYRNESTKSIYDFNNNLILLIKGNDCAVSKLTDDPVASFFPFTQDQKSKKLTIGKPEEVFYFTKSILRTDVGFTIFPAVIYEAKMDFPMYHLTNCNVTHVFTNPVVEVPDCGNHRCQPTLVAISVRCPESKETGQKVVDHDYSFFRFRPGISDESSFVPPPGIHCDVTNRVPFPGLPEYFSFSYDLVEEVRDVNTGPGVFFNHRKVWYDSKLQLLRVDEFQDGFLEFTRIFDKYGGAAYAITASLTSCYPSAMGETIPFEELTRLPSLMFKETITEKDVIYVGKRKTNALEYEVWSSSITSEETQMKKVQEFYFSKIATSIGEQSKLQLSHADFYVYHKNTDTDLFELLGHSHLVINNFRSKPKDWEAFDVSACFTHEQRKGFRLNVTGPPVIKNSIQYENLLERMYMRIIFVTNISVIRISELEGVFDGTYITEFTGLILEKTDVSETETGKSESDMLQVYNLLENAASSGKLNIKLTRNGKEVEYVVQLIKDVEEPRDKHVTGGDGGPISGGALAAIALMSLIGVILIGWGIYVFQKKRRGDMKHVQMDNLK